MAMLWLYILMFVLAMFIMIVVLRYSGQRNSR
jgi:hypothetical protein